MFGGRRVRSRSRWVRQPGVTLGQPDNLGPARGLSAPGLFRVWATLWASGHVGGFAWRVWRRVRRILQRVDVLDPNFPRPPIPDRSQRDRYRGSILRQSCGAAQERDRQTAMVGGFR